MSFSGVLRAAFLSCAALLVSVFSSLAQAMTPEEADNLLSSIHQMRVESYLAINAYYNFSISNGDKSLAAEATSTVNRIDAHLSQLNAAPGAADIQADLVAIATQWKRYRELLKTNLNDLVKLGYPDLRLAVEMAQANVDFVNTLGQLGDTRLFLLGALLMADELFEMRGRLGALQGEVARLQNDLARTETKSIAALEAAAQRIEKLANG